MKRLVVHIGAHKTGTTSIQGTLRFNRAYLETQGINYVPIGLGPSPDRIHGQHNLAWGMIGDRRHDPKGASWPDALRHMAKSPLQAHVISSEAFSRFGDEQVARLREILSGLDVRVVFFVRRHIDAVNSNLRQNGVKWNPDTIEAFCERVYFRRRRPVVGFRPRVEPWVRAFGRERVAVAVFEREKADLAGAVLREAGVAWDPSGVEQKRLNVARATPHLRLNMAICGALKGIVQPAFYDAVLAPELSRVVSALGLKAGSEDFVPDSVVERLVDHVKDDVAWFRDLGVDLPHEYDGMRGGPAAPLEPYDGDVGRMAAALLLTAARDALRARRKPGLIGKATGLDKAAVERLAVIEGALERLGAGLAAGA